MIISMKREKNDEFTDILEEFVIWTRNCIHEKVKNLWKNKKILFI